MTNPAEPTTVRKPLPPHSPLPAYYETEEERLRFVREIFDKSAKHYNTIELLLLNGGLLYRRFSLRRAGLRKGMKVLDVAIGTAAVARGAVKIVGEDGAVFGVDPSSGMLGEARKVFHGPLTRGVAEALPFRDDTFDFVTMGLALRHVSDLVTTFGEYLRVLKPGGTLWILESHVPTSKLGHRLTRFAWARMVPAMTLASTRSRDAKLLMDFYWDTIDKCVPPATIHQAIRDVGFIDTRYRLVMPGAVCEYTGKKPSR
jgi:demethylmenaquinone methyltransferase/2-methoxy-6-polyprenyl-1,4-benzoquinol methylase